QIERPVGLFIAWTEQQRLLEGGGSAPEIAGPLGVRLDAHDIREPAIEARVRVDQPLIGQRLEGVDRRAELAAPEGLRGALEQIIGLGRARRQRERREHDRQGGGEDAGPLAHGALIRESSWTSPLAWENRSLEALCCAGSKRTLSQVESA